MGNLKMMTVGDKLIVPFREPKPLMDGIREGMEGILHVITGDLWEADRVRIYGSDFMEVNLRRLENKEGHYDLIGRQRVHPIGAVKWFQIRFTDATKYWLSMAWAEDWRDTIMGHHIFGYVSCDNSVPEHFTGRGCAANTLEPPGLNGVRYDYIEWTKD